MTDDAFERQRRAAREWERKAGVWEDQSRMWKARWEEAELSRSAWRQAAEHWKAKAGEAPEMTVVFDGDGNPRLVKVESPTRVRLTGLATKGDDRE